MSQPSASAFQAEPCSWRESLDEAKPAMLRLLQDSLSFPSVSGQENDFVRFIEQWARGEGFQTDLWNAAEAQLARYPQARLPHLPLTGRPTLVIRLPGHSNGRSLLFNAHADVVAAGDPAGWRFGPWSGEYSNGLVHGRGACDTKGPLVSALWAMWAIKRAMPNGLAGDVLLELIPGEEDCVGPGTLTSVERGWRGDGVIVLEPTESLPRCASRGGCRFQVVCHGRAVHGTVKWLGDDAIQTLRRVLDALEKLEQRWNERDADPLFAHCPIARPVTVDSVTGGLWQGMICDRAQCAGYLELLPNDPLDDWKSRFAEELQAELHAYLQERGKRLEINFSEEYSGHRTEPSHPLCQIAGQVVERHDASPEEQDMSLTGFNSGCEAGVRAGLQGTPTLVWGPGSLAQAHATDESIDFSDVQRVAGMFAEFLAWWSNDGRNMLDGLHHQSM
jgi:acetylornithine deacetylase